MSDFAESPDSPESLKELFAQADKIGKKRYHRLTQQDFDDYRRFDYWRYLNGNSELGTTQQSKQWVRDNSEQRCPICNQRYGDRKGRTIDHKLPRAQYPWLSLDFRNLWVICHLCNQEKGERHWYEYERYILANHPALYENVQFARPRQLLKSLQ